MYTNYDYVLCELCICNYLLNGVQSWVGYMICVYTHLLYLYALSLNCSIMIGIPIMICLLYLVQKTQRHTIGKFVNFVKHHNWLVVSHPHGGKVCESIEITILLRLKQTPSKQGRNAGRLTGMIFSVGPRQRRPWEGVGFNV